MIRLGLRFAVAGGREAIARLAVIAAAVAVGTLLLLTVLSGLNGFFAQNQRLAWLNSGDVSGRGPGTGAEAGDAAGGGLWWRLGYDLYQGRSIARVDVAADGPGAPVPPGIGRLPAAGEYYLSPELAALIRSVPADQLADRYPGRAVGQIGPAALQSPTSLSIIIGHRPDELSHDPEARLIHHIWGTSAAECDTCGGAGITAAGIDLVLAVVVGGLLFPLLIFIATVTRLSAARREERFAALRLIGATPKQIAVMATVEATAAATVGTVVGFVLLAALRSRIAAIPFTGEPFFVDDVRVGVGEAVAVALGVPAAAALAARIAVRRAVVSPLGVSRRAAPPTPRVYRLLPIGVGIAELAYLDGHRPSTSIGQSVSYMAGFLVVMIGLVTAGPWLTSAGARFLAGRARRPASLVAARRLADNPRAGFRAVSGLMLALFIGSAATGVITTINAMRGPAAAAAQMRGTLTQDFSTAWSRSGIPVTELGNLATQVVAITGVRDVTLIRSSPGGSEQFDGLVSCAELSRIVPRMQCPPGAQVAEIGAGMQFQGPVGGPHLGGAAPIWPWPARNITVAALDGLPVRLLVVRTDGSAGAIERTRTMLERANPRRFPPSLNRELANPFVSTLAGWQQLADVVIVASLVLAGFSLAAAVAGGLTERRRPFSLLRLTGVPLGVLRRVIILETGIPLLGAAVVATAAGFIAADEFLSAQMQYQLRAPDSSFFLLCGGGLVASIVIITSMLPLLRRISRPETARNG